MAVSYKFRIADLFRPLTADVSRFGLGWDQRTDTQHLAINVCLLACIPMCVCREHCWRAKLLDMNHTRVEFLGYMKDQILAKRILVVLRRPFDWVWSQIWTLTTRDL